MATNLDRLKEVLVTAAKTAKEEDRFARYDDVVRLFEALVKVTKEIEPSLSKKLNDSLDKKVLTESKRLEADLARLNKRLAEADQLIREAKQSRSDEVGKLTARLDKETQKIVESCHKVLQSMQKEMAEYASIDDVMGFFERALENLSGEEVRDRLEALEGDDRLDKSAIKGLEEELDEIRQIKTSKSGGGGITGKDVIQKYDLSSFLDGVTKTFNIPGNWTILDVSGTSFPYQFRRLVDYTFTNQSITFTDQVDAAGSLGEGQTVEILYVIG